jgi:hypothetical protein
MHDGRQAETIFVRPEHVTSMSRHWQLLLQSVIAPADLLLLGASRSSKVALSADGDGEKS